MFLQIMSCDCSAKIPYFILTDEFRRKRIAVVVISFGIEKGAKVWLEETKCIFPMFLDHERTFYESFGLQRSIEKV